MPEVFLSLGSNIDPELHLSGALAELAAEFGPLRMSSCYRSAAVGFVGPPFHNLVVAFATDRPAEDIAAILAVIEARHGRIKGPKKAASVTLDIDLLLYGQDVFHRGRLRVPRPDMIRQSFVLEPLAEIAPNLLHPGTDASYSDLWARFDKEDLMQFRIEFDRLGYPMTD